MNFPRRIVLIKGFFISLKSSGKALFFVFLSLELLSSGRFSDQKIIIPFTISFD